MQAYRRSRRSKHRDRLHRPSSGAVERRQAEVGAEGSNRPAEAGHRKPAGEEGGSSPAGADRSLAPERRSLAEGSLCK